jgi:hypothetical protein
MYAVKEKLRLPKICINIKTWFLVKTKVKIPDPEI